MFVVRNEVPAIFFFPSSSVDGGDLGRGRDDLDVGRVEQTLRVGDLDETRPVLEGLVVRVPADAILSTTTTF